MSLTIDWMAAAAEAPKSLTTEGAEEPRESQNPHPVCAKNAQTRMGQPQFESNGSGHFLSRHEEEARERRIYRGRTVAMLRRYFRYSMETGRMPSLLGREFFRSKVTRYTVVTFEDRVIFVHDMERCLDKLDEESRQVIARVVLQEYEQEEAARLLGCTRMTVHRKLIEGLDRLSGILRNVGLLESISSSSEKPCQEGKERENFLTCCSHDK